MKHLTILHFILSLHIRKILIYCEALEKSSFSIHFQCGQTLHGDTWNNAIAVELDTIHILVFLVTLPNCQSFHCTKFLCQYFQILFEEILSTPGACLFRLFHTQWRDYWLSYCLPPHRSHEARLQLCGLNKIFFKFFYATKIRYYSFFQFWWHCSAAFWFDSNWWLICLGDCHRSI